MGETVSSRLLALLDVLLVLVLAAEGYARGGRLLALPIISKLVNFF